MSRSPLDVVAVPFQRCGRNADGGGHHALRAGQLVAPEDQPLVGPRRHRRLRAETVDVVRGLGADRPLDRRLVRDERHRLHRPEDVATDGGQAARQLETGGREHVGDSDVRDDAAGAETSHLTSTPVAVPVAERARGRADDRRPGQDRVDAGARAQTVVDDGGRRRLRGHQLADLGQQRLGGGRASHVHRGRQRGAVRWRPRSAPPARRPGRPAAPVRGRRAPHGASGSGRSPPSGPSSEDAEVVVERQLAGEPARAVGRRAAVGADGREAGHALLARAVARRVWVARAVLVGRQLYGLVSVSSSTEHPVAPAADRPQTAKTSAASARRGREIAPNSRMRSGTICSAPRRSCDVDVTSTAGAIPPGRRAPPGRPAAAAMWVGAARPGRGRQRSRSVRAPIYRTAACSRRRVASARAVAAAASAPVMLSATPRL